MACRLIRVLEGPLFSCSSLTNEETETQKKKTFAGGHGLIQAGGQVDGLWLPASPLLLPPSHSVMQLNLVILTPRFIILLIFFPGKS